MIGPVRQIAWLVPDLEAATRLWSAAHRVGPWFASDPMPTAKAVYRGEPGHIALRAASAYSGDLEIELIQPLGDDRSIYREAVEQMGYGLHHVCHHSDALDEDITRMTAKGYELVQEFWVGEFRIVYLGTPGSIGSYVELIQMTPEVDALMAGWRRAAADWDGRYAITCLNHGGGTPK